MGLTRIQAQHLLDRGWDKKAIVAIHDLLFCDFYFEIEKPWYVRVGNLALYKSYTVSDIENAFRSGVISDPVIAYTDGSGTVSDKPAGIGVIVYRPDQAPTLYAENIGPGTNNRAELTAIWRALRAVPHLSQSIQIYSDSEYAIGSVTKDWVAKANAGLIANIRKDLSFRKDVKISHVNGHAGVDGNEIADRLSGIGRKLVKQVSVYED